MTQPTGQPIRTLNSTQLPAQLDAATQIQPDSGKFRLLAAGPYGWISFPALNGQHVWYLVDENGDGDYRDVGETYNFYDSDLAGPAGQPTLTRLLTIVGVLPSVAGDLNCDGALDLDDIEPFVLALVDPSGYATVYPTCDSKRADVNGDTYEDGLDILMFVDMLLAQ